MTKIVTLLSDFGLQDPYAGVMKGVIFRHCPDCQVVDLTHLIPPQNVWLGAIQLERAVPHFPQGTVHLAVVDPGVGLAGQLQLGQHPAHRGTTRLPGGTGQAQFGGIAQCRLEGQLMVQDIVLGHQPDAVP